MSTATIKHIYLTVEDLIGLTGTLHFVPATAKRVNVYLDSQIHGFCDYEVYNHFQSIDWRQVEQAERHGHSTEYFIDGYVNGEKKYEAIGSYTVAGNELEEIRDVEGV